MRLSSRPHLLPARRGAAWVGLGFRLFHQQPLVWFVTMVSYWLVLVLVSSLPLVGIAVSMALSQVMAFGLVALAFAIDKRDPEQPATPATLFSGFRMGRETAIRLIQLGLIYGALLGLLLLVSIGLDPSAGPSTLEPKPAPESPDEALEQMSQGFSGWLLLLAALYVPVLMAFWFAPQLVVWQQLAPLKALFFSLVAVWLNKGAFLRYGLLWVGVILASSAGLGLLITAIGLSGGGLLMAVLPLSLLLMAIGHASAYISTREVLGVDSPADTTTSDPA
ncbi:MAG: BPSS1780 family membrane protein [Burkholderiaceae bacterium]